ncbi:MAG: Ku protein [Armatimonadota bacterium]
MPTAIWTGAISFGLVHVPVRLVTAVQDAGPDFHLLDRETGQRIRHRTVNESGDEVERDRIVKGYEASPEQYLVVEDEELAQLTPERSQTIEIGGFVELGQIDPIYYDRPYYLLPEEGARKPYKLLMAAMERAQKVGIAQFVLHGREHLTALRPLNGVLCLVLMRFAEQVRPTQELGLDLDEIEMRDEELEVAIQLIDAMTEQFDPTQYRDEYLERVRELLKAKAEGEEYVAPKPVEERVEVAGLVDALKKSLERVKSK